MSASTADAPISDADEHVTPDASTLDRYIGYYVRDRTLGVSTITRKDTKLVLEPIGQPALELEQTGEADFAIQSSNSCCTSNRSKMALRSGW